MHMMNLAESSVGNGDVLLWMLEFFLFVIWFWLLVIVFSDLFRDHETSGWAKALWIILVIVLPYLGVLLYLIVRGRGMAERNLKQQQAMKQQMDAQIRAAVGTGASPADQIAQAKALLDSGAVTQAEFEALKAKALTA
ncbi:SHOCT domain-containing protein [Catellatospora sp. KI3]|uniref:SHOCT domain-containing protein n=1 Tax=Catellatospora sp. KI3 TaxID=3041620 RepID=UPI0024825169|nr:SHOCT domain-containing protein [Catellatospora sp. KI3]MDI1460928.1 SHOCT domain-containing protein [Catellatospora sp. KI3]